MKTFIILSLAAICFAGPRKSAFLFPAPRNEDFKISETWNVQKRSDSEESATESAPLSPQSPFDSGFVLVNPNHEDLTLGFQGAPKQAPVHSESSSSEEANAADANSTVSSSEENNVPALTQGDSSSEEDNAPDGQGNKSSSEESSSASDNAQVSSSEENNAPAVNQEDPDSQQNDAAVAEENQPPSVKTNVAAAAPQEPSNEQNNSPAVNPADPPSQQENQPPSVETEAANPNPHGPSSVETKAANPNPQGPSNDNGLFLFLQRGPRYQVNRRNVDNEGPRPAYRASRNRALRNTEFNYDLNTGRSQPLAPQGQVGKGRRHRQSK